MNSRKNLIYCLFIFLHTPFLFAARSPHRPPEPGLPTIYTRWEGEKAFYALAESHLREGALFHLFDRTHFQKNLIPSGPISFRYEKSKSVSGETLSCLIENFLQEILDKKTNFTDFTILKQKDFNKKQSIGLVIAKFKNYPFVVKLFIETPQSFVNPFGKGFEPICFHMMGGGCNRHLSGFTRIKNLDYIRKRVSQIPQWRNRVSFPRKWHWLPKNKKWMTLESRNIGPQKKQSITFPGVYAIIADYVEIDRCFSLKNQQDRRVAMKLSNDLQQNIDPHINNFAIEKHTGKIVAFDTEHFPTFVGIENPKYCRSYTQWYSHLASKMVADTMFRTKKKRRKQQFMHSRPIGPIEN